MRETLIKTVRFVIPETAKRLSGIQQLIEKPGFRVLLSAAPE